MTNEISIVSSNKFMGLADGNLLNWCPTLNLITVTMNKMSVWVYRLNGERIYSVNNKSPITAITFMKNGLYFCLAGIDGKIKIFDSNNGKLIKILQSDFNQVKLINWNFHIYKSYGKFDNLFKVDVLDFLPLISLNEEIPTSDINEINNNSNDVNFLIIVDSKRLCITFNNLLVVDDISTNLKGIEFKHHLDNNDLFNQYFLVETEDHKDQLLQWSIQVKHKKYLVDIIVKICKIINILSYLESQLQFCQTKVKPFIQLYDRYLSNLSDCIEGEDLTVYLFDLLLTNLIPENTKDYWLNEFGERGYKRLNKLGTVMYDSLRNVMFVQIIACLERLCILLNDLHSLSKWLKDSDPQESFGLNPLMINDLLIITKNFLKKVYKLIWEINKEQELFNNFIEWIKTEIIEKISNDEPVGIPIVKETDIISYLNGSLFNSKIWDYINLDLSNNDILTKQENPQLLPTLLEQLTKEFRIKLLQPISTFFRSNLKFDLINLPINLSTNSKLHYINENFSIITSFSKSSPTSLSLLKFSYEDPTQAISSQLEFQNEIINYQVYKDQVITLIKDENQSYQIVKSNLTTLSSKIIPFPQLSNPQNITLNAEYGCVLDSNRQNYIVFKY